MEKKSMLIVAILLMSIGFAAVSTTLVINGNAKVSENNEDFSVIFTAASIDGKDVYSTVIDDTKKIITFETNELKTLNQTSILTYEVTNNSSNYDAEVSVTCVPKEETTKYTSIKNKLDNDATVVKAKETLNGTLTITLDKTSTEELSEEYTCKLEFNAVERDTLGVENIPDPVSFATDSWKTIQKAVQTGNTSKYNVGDTKTITISSHINDCASSDRVDNTDYGEEHEYCKSYEEAEKQMVVRISNMSECTNGETSETACGFVVEFVDIIEKHDYNSEDENEMGTNKGGWRDSELRKYINETLYNALPNDLQSVIAITKVISSHGTTEGETNFETQDKLYLLSIHEVYEDGTINQISDYDTSYNDTKQLDYYKNVGVTSSNYAGAIKQYNGNNDYWWLRSVGFYSKYGNTESFDTVYKDGNNDGSSSGCLNGISPAFRIA